MNQITTPPKTHSKYSNISVSISKNDKQCSCIVYLIQSDEMKERECYAGKEPLPHNHLIMSVGKYSTILHSAPQRPAWVTELIAKLSLTQVCVL